MRRDAVYKHCMLCRSTAAMYTLPNLMAMLLDAAVAGAEATVRQFVTNKGAQAHSCNFQRLLCGAFWSWLALCSLWRTHHCR
jgi:hypothetical protein